MSPPFRWPGSHPAQTRSIRPTWPSAARAGQAAEHQRGAGAAAAEVDEVDDVAERVHDSSAEPEWGAPADSRLRFAEVWPTTMRVGDTLPRWPMPCLPIRTPMPVPHSSACCSEPLGLMNFITSPCFRGLMTGGPAPGGTAQTLPPRGVSERVSKAKT